MKTYKKVLFHEEYEGNAQYTGKVKTYIEIIMYFDFKEGLRFTASVANYSWCFKNPINALIRVLEHESIGMAKYDALKEEYRKSYIYKTR